MSVTQILCTLLLMFLIRYLIKVFEGRRSRFPPGPPSVPLLGCLPFLRGDGVEKWVSDYICSFGPVTGFTVGANKVAMINEWKLAKSLFSKEEFSGRLMNYTTLWARSVKGKSLGLVFSDGSFHAGQKNFCMKHLRNFGFGKRDFQSVIAEQARELVAYLETREGNVKINNGVFSLSAVNLIWSLLAGYSFKRGDEKVQGKELLDDLVFIFSSKILLAALMFPWLRFIFPSYTGYNKRLDILHKMRTFFYDEIEKHERELDEDNPRDYIDVFLIEKKRTNNPEFDADQLMMTIFDLFGAGADTTSSTLCWAVLFLALHRDVQERCYTEICRETEGREVVLEDSQRLHWCQAVMAEVQRHGQVALTTVMHRTTRQYELPSGHVLPRDCLVQSNLKKFMTDPAVWDDTTAFKPERFLAEDGKFTKPEYFVPFGHGKRMCLGEPLARAELFIFLVTLVKNFEFSTTEDFRPDPKKFSAGFTKSPIEFQVNLVKRK